MNEYTQPLELKGQREHYRPITGHASYVDDLRSPSSRPSPLHIVFVRSPHAHAKILNIDLSAARELPGVVAAFTGAELVEEMPPLAAMPMPGLSTPERRPLAVGRVRFVGDPVAVVLATDRYIAEDARDLVDVEYDPLPAVTDLEAALEPNAPLLYDELGANVAFVQQSGGGDIAAAFAQADHVVRLRLMNQRLAPSSLEPRACLFDFEAERGELVAWVSSQGVYRVREMLASFLGLDRGRIRVHNADVGGGFGAKNVFVGEEFVTALLAMKLARPVKWIESRTENLQAQAQGRGVLSYVEAAFQHDGRLLGLRTRSFGDLGAFLMSTTAMVFSRMPAMVCGPYQVQAVENQMIGVFTNKTTTAPYRGAGRPEAAYIVERVMDRIAQETDLDPALVRSRNFIPPEAFPHRTVTGLLYDSGNYQAALDRVLELADYAGWRARQRAAREAADTRLLGIGLTSFIEISGDSIALPANQPAEAATVRIRDDGTLLVQSGVAHNGQGHFTAFAQIAASIFNLPPAQVEVQMNDSSLPAYSIGTFGSRITQIAGSAVLLAAEAVKEKALQLAASMLEVAPDDLELANGRIAVRGMSSRFVELAELARRVEELPSLIAREAPNPANGAPIEGLAAWRDFRSPGATFSSGSHIAVVEIDTETGDVRILHYVAVDDCGRVLNYELVEGQIHGSLAQGIGQALYEEAAYDQDGQLISSTLMDYGLPLAKMIPTFVSNFIETPSPFNPLGAKGAGESGCIGAPAAVVSAVLDALAPLGIQTIDMPLWPEKIWALIHAAQQGTLAQPEPVLPPLRSRS